MRSREEGTERSRKTTEIVKEKQRDGEKRKKEENEISREAQKINKVQLLKRDTKAIRLTIVCNM